MTNENISWSRPFDGGTSYIWTLNMDHTSIIHRSIDRSYIVCCGGICSSYEEMHNFWLETFIYIHICIYMYIWLYSEIYAMFSLYFLLSRFIGIWHEEELCERMNKRIIALRWQGDRGHIRSHGCSHSRDNWWPLCGTNVGVTSSPPWWNYQLPGGIFISFSSNLCGFFITSNYA